MGNPQFYSKFLDIFRKIDTLEWRKGFLICDLQMEIEILQIFCILPECSMCPLFVTQQTTSR